MFSLHSRRSRYRRLGSGRVRTWLLGCCLRGALVIASIAIPVDASGQVSKKTPSPRPADVVIPQSDFLAKAVDGLTTPRQGRWTSSPKATSSPKPADGSSPKATPSPMPVDVSSLKPDDLRSFDANPPDVQQLLTAALELTERKLGYLYGSADPERGGMDCSGTIYFLLQKAGMADAPRSASLQYVWVRKADTFHAVVSNRADSFELDDLRPGDLLFWTGTYAVDTDPPVTHSMIYLGKARSDGRPLMVGASDGRAYRGDKKFGVSVFDFVLPKPNGKNPASRFIGYAKIPR